MLPFLERGTLDLSFHKKTTTTAAQSRTMAKSCDKKQQSQQHQAVLVITRTLGVRRASILAIFTTVAIFLLLSLDIKNFGSDEEKVAETPRCDLFSGRWVYDNTSYPLYLEKDCMFMSDQLACQKFGRKDLKYQSWRWQPYSCDLPRFNATRLLERLKGKRMVFVGDSLNRGQWVSMICLLGTVISATQKSMETNGNLISFKAKAYNASIEFYWAPLLVESNSDNPVNHRLPDRIIRAHSIEKHARHWSDADILVFNSYLWWKQPGIKVLWGSFNDTDGVSKEVGMLRSYELVLKTWADWVEFNIDPAKTRLFFMTLSPTHSWAEEWGGGSDGNCYNETGPIAKEGHKGKDSDERITGIVKASIEDLRRRGVDVDMIDVTQLSEYRKDGHPSIYRKQWEPLSEAQVANPSSYADCIHWCLPGVPDVWNELLYSYIFNK